MSRFSASFGTTVSAALLLLALASCERRPQASARELLTTRTLGLAYMEENRLDEAEAEFKKLAAMAPGESMGFANLGLVYLRKGSFREAERNMRRALELEPGDPDIRLMLATVLELTDRRDEAQRELERTLRDAPDHLKSLYALAQLSAGATDQAGRARREGYLRTLVELAPGNVAARLLLIEVLLRNAKPDEALAHLEQLRARIPELPAQAESFHDAAVEHMREGRADGALQPMLTLTNFLKVTGAYQAGIMDLEGPGGVLIGFPIVTFSRPIAEVQEVEDVLAALRFTDATGLAGLSAIPGGEVGRTHLAVADYDGDGDQDLYVASSERSWLLRNDLGVFVDVSAKSGIGTGGGLTAVFGDYDNDGHLDLYVAREGENLLLRNRGDGTFRDVGRSAGVADAGRSHASLFLDADDDGDLDLYLTGEGPDRLYRNNGDGRFVEMAQRMGLAGVGETGIDVDFGDLDGDAGLDIVLASEDSGAILYRNLFGGRFEDVTGRSGLTPGVGLGLGAMAVGDYNNDGFLDLLLAASGGGSRLYLNRGDGTFDLDARPSTMYQALADFTPRDARFLDFDNDGWLDLLIAGETTEAGRGVLLFRNGAPGRFDDMSSLLPEDLGPARQLAVLDHAEDGDLDIVVVRSDGRVRLLRNDGGDANHYLKIRLTGLRVGSSRNNHFGIGSKIEVRTGGAYQMRVVTDPMTHFGLGERLKADVVRIVWTNGVPQNVLYPGSDQDLVEEQVLKGSCPFLYAWNGERYEFVTDVMWRSALGMPLDIMGGARGYAPAAASREYVKIPGAALRAKDGKYSIQLTGELWETGYADEVKLVVLDHPDSVDVYVDERFVPPGPAELRIYQVVAKHLPVVATDERGRDLLPLLRERDDRYVSQLELGKYQGLTEMHDLVLDLGEAATTGDVTLFLNGWIFPTDASINVAMSQANGLMSVPPQVQVVDRDGQWRTVIENMSFPSGKAKTVVVDLGGKFLSTDRRVRIRTNMRIYWDHAFFTTGEVGAPVRRTTLAPTAADFHFRGFSRMYRKGGRYGPHWFDYGSVTTEQKWLDLEGSFTRHGDVVELLTLPDDKYVIFGPGDEITVEFDPREAPPLPAGWRRDFLLYSVSWLKDADLNTGAGQSVDPLPFHGMSRYPYGPDESYPTDEDHRRYLSTYNTRRR